MKLTKRAIKKLSKQARLKLALSMDFSEQWINRLVEHNKDNGPLTTVTAMQIIMQETGLTQDEILEPAAVKAA